MLVTDGATEMYDDVFEKYNWPERKVCLFVCVLHINILILWLLSWRLEELVMYFITLLISLSCSIYVRMVLFTM